MEEFIKYKNSILLEARGLLENKGEFLSSRKFSIDFKLLRLSELVDFFILEGEELVVKELCSVADVLRIKKILTSPV